MYALLSYVLARGGTHPQLTCCKRAKGFLQRSNLRHVSIPQKQYAYVVDLPVKNFLLKTYFDPYIGMGHSTRSAIVMNTVRPRAIFAILFRWATSASSVAWVRAASEPGTSSGSTAPDATDVRRMISVSSPRAIIFIDTQS